MSEIKQTILIAAGGTGGHMFPAKAFADEMVARGFDIILVTDPRGRRYTEGFPSIDNLILSVTNADEGGLKGKKALVTLTLGGREHMFGENAIHGELVDGMLRPLLRGTLAYVGLDVLPPFIGFHVPYISQEAREQILVDYKNYLANLDDLTPLRYPHMDEFDGKLYPK